MENALTALAAARHVGVVAQTSVEGLALFKGVKRRLELLGQPQGVAGPESVVEAGQDSVGAAVVIDTDHDRA